MTTFVAQWMILLGRFGAVLLTLYLVGWAIWRTYKWIRRKWR